MDVLVTFLVTATKYLTQTLKGPKLGVILVPGSRVQSIMAAEVSCSCLHCSQDAGINAVA